MRNVKRVSANGQSNAAHQQRTKVSEGTHANAIIPIDEELGYICYEAVDDKALCSAFCRLTVSER